MENLIFKKERMYKSFLLTSRIQTKAKDLCFSVQLYITCYDNLILIVQKKPFMGSILEEQKIYCHSFGEILSNRLFDGFTHNLKDFEKDFYKKIKYFVKKYKVKKSYEYPIFFNNF